MTPGAETEVRVKATLYQRDREFPHYEDMEAKYEIQPSVWIEPVGDWGRGAVELIALPTNNEYQDNVVAFWRPESSPEAGDRLDIEYVMRWYMNHAERPALGFCTQTRMAPLHNDAGLEIYVHFGGGRLPQLGAGEPVSIEVHTEPDGLVTKAEVVKLDSGDSWRATLGISRPDTGEPVEIRCLLRQNEQRLSETWTYSWIP